MLKHSHGSAAGIAILDSFLTGLTAKTAVRLATTAALAANSYSNGTSGVGATITASGNGALSVDSVAVAVGDRVLVKDEATASHNGIYGVTATGDGSNPFVLTRATDGDQAAEIAGEAVIATVGTVNAGLCFVNTNGSAPTVGTTNLFYATVRAFARTKVDAAPQTLTDQATIAYDLASGVNGVVTLAGNRTLALPTNLYPGARGELKVVQDGTGSRTLAYASGWLFPAGAPTASTGANAIDVIRWWAPDATHVYGVMTKAYA